MVRLVKKILPSEKTGTDHDEEKGRWVRNGETSALWCSTQYLKKVLPASYYTEQGVCHVAASHSPSLV